MGYNKKLRNVQYSFRECLEYTLLLFGITFRVLFQYEYTLKVSSHGVLLSLAIISIAFSTLLILLRIILQEIIVLESKEYYLAMSIVSIIALILLTIFIYFIIPLLPSFETIKEFICESD